MSIAFVTEIGQSCVEMRASQPARKAFALSLLAGLILVVSPMVRAEDAPADLTVEQIDRALLVTYFHGIPEEVALREVGVAGVPRILEHLADPGYPRRDNLVAFLWSLGGAESRDALLDAFTRQDLSMAIPEEDRARLMIPHALGKLASRGDEESLELLLSIANGGTAVNLLNRAAAGYPDPGLAQVDLLENVLRGLALSGADRARDHLVDVGLGRNAGMPPGRDLSGPALDLVDLMDELEASSSGSVASRAAASGASTQSDPGAEGPGPDPLGQSHHVELGTHADEGEIGTLIDDTQGSVHENRLTYANHVSISNPMDNDRLDTVFLEANRRIGAANYSIDVACCAMLRRTGNASTFGFTGDGLDSIDNSSDAAAVIGHSVARVKVVRQINWCGGTQPGIIGCAYTPGFGMALVRMTGVNWESILWAHEYGHNTGLQHAPSDSRRIMWGSATGSNNVLTQGECNRFHAPSTAANASVSNIGQCEDSDGDSVHDILDNCPQDLNLSQTDSDGDGAGNACDNCQGLYNPDQENHDGDPDGDLCDEDDDNDGVPDDEDCAPTNPFASQAPSEPFNLGWSDQDTSTMTWQNGTFSFSTNVYRGAVGMGTDGGWDCLDDSVFGTSFEDSEEPELGEGFRYILTGENTCGESTAGSYSDGTERQPDPCP